MNLRKKAKYYKKRAENLEKLTSPKLNFGIVYKHAPIITLKTSQIVDEDLLYEINANENCYLRRVEKLIEKNLMSQIINYADIRSEQSYEGLIMTATIKVVDMRGVEQ